MRLWLVLALLLASGCTGGAADAGPPVREARVGLLEWEVTASASTLAAGPVRLEVTNAGATAHDLRVTGQRTEGAVPVLPPGDTAVLELDLSGASEVTLWCSLPGHRAQGMERRLPVLDD